MGRGSDAGDSTKKLKAPNTTNPAAYIEEWREDAMREGLSSEEAQESVAAVQDQIKKMPGATARGTDISPRVDVASPDARQGTPIKESQVRDLSTDPADALNLDLRPSLARAAGPGRSGADLDVDPEGGTDLPGDAGADPASGDTGATSANFGPDAPEFVADDGLSTDQRPDLSRATDHDKTGLPDRWPDVSMKPGTADTPGAEAPSAEAPKAQTPEVEAPKAAAPTPESSHAHKSLPVPMPEMPVPPGRLPPVPMPEVPLPPGRLPPVPMPEMPGLEASKTPDTPISRTETVQAEARNHGRPELPKASDDDRPGSVDQRPDVSAAAERNRPATGEQRADMPTVEHTGPDEQSKLPEAEHAADADLRPEAVDDSRPDVSAAAGRRQPDLRDKTVPAVERAGPDGRFERPEAVPAVERAGPDGQFKRPEFMLLAASIKATAGEKQAQPTAKASTSPETKAAQAHKGQGAHHGKAAHHAGADKTQGDRVKRAVKDAEAAKLKVDVEAYPHKVAPDVRAAQGRSGKVDQSAHVGPTSALRDTAGYVRGEALATLLNRKTHFAFDSQWQKAFRVLVKQGRTDLTVGELHEEVAKALQNTEGLTQRQKDTLQWMLHKELYGDLGLKPDETVRLPYAKSAAGPKTAAPAGSGAAKVPETAAKAIVSTETTPAVKAAGGNAPEVKTPGGKAPEVKISLHGVAKGAALIGLGLGAGLLESWERDKTIQSQIQQGFEKLDPEIKAKVEALSPQAATLQADKPGAQLYAHVTVQVRILHDLDDAGGGMLMADYKPAACLGVQVSSVSLSTEPIDTPREGKTGFTGGFGNYTEVRTITYSIPVDLQQPGPPVA